MSDLFHTANQVRARLSELANPQIAEHSQRFFKTGPGEYGEGDQFLGIRVPIQRREAKRARNLPLDEVLDLLRTAVHEERLTALIILVNTFERADPEERQSIFDAYLANTSYINNWDLVDSSSHQIIGGHLFTRDRSILVDLAESESLWERRIAIVCTYHFIKRDQFVDTLLISEILLGDTQDLIHKAVGWMLREMGKKNQEVETEFLLRHYQNMPRTMLRYAIERYPEDERQAFLKGTA